MTFGEIKIMALEKMFLNDTPIDETSLNALENDNNYSIYLSKMAPACNEALQIIYSRGYPKYVYENNKYKQVEVEQLKRDTANDYVFKTYLQAVVLLPLYIASQLYKDDDISLATQYRNEFEVGVDELTNNIENNQINVVYTMEG